jgi:thioesterase domain-containing protein
LRELFAAPTLRGFTSLLEAGGVAQLPSSLTPFRQRGSTRPIFFVHSGLGDIGYVNALVPFIDAELPVYGLTAVGYLDGEQPLETLEELAAAHVRAIRQVQPHGPYRLAGWCAGGNVAFEMAHQLLDADEQVEFLGFLDSPSRAPVDPSELASVLSRIPDVIPDALRARLNELGAAGDTRGMLLACQAAQLLPADLPIELLERYLAVQHKLKLAKVRYVPPRLPVTVRHFIASEEHHADWDMDGWDRVADAVIRIPVGGNHMSMVDAPHAAALAARICDALVGLEADELDGCSRYAGAAE